MIKKIFWCIACLLACNNSAWSATRLDIEAHRPEVLIEDLVNLTDTDLELKDDDQLRHLLLVIDDELKNPQNDFDGEFNIPEITDHAPGAHDVGPYSKRTELQRLKQRIIRILRMSEEE